MWVVVGGFYFIPNSLQLYKWFTTEESSELSVADEFIKNLFWSGPDMVFDLLQNGRLRAG